MLCGLILPGAYPTQRVWVDALFRSNWRLPTDCGRVTLIGDQKPPGSESNPSGGLILCKFLILRNDKIVKNHKNAQARYTAGTRNDRKVWQNSHQVVSFPEPVYRSRAEHPANLHLCVKTRLR